ncbi:M55 family metallopeptidase, partial [Serratia sp. IR-2025]
MKVFISADIEGIAGVMRPEQCNPAHADYAAARELMEQEVNAAIDGAFAGGGPPGGVAARPPQRRANRGPPRAGGARRGAGEAPGGW